MPDDTLVYEEYKSYIWAPFFHTLIWNMTMLKGMEIEQVTVVLISFIKFQDYSINLINISKTLYF